MKIFKSVEKSIGNLSAELIDEFSERIASVLSGLEYSSRDVLRFRLSAESAMLGWLEKFGAGAKCSLETVKRFGRISIIVSCDGQMYDPRDIANEEFGNLADSSILQTLGLTIGYSYDNGVNRITIMPPNSNLFSQIIPIAIAMILGIGLSVGLKTYSQDISFFVSDQIVGPFFEMLMNLLKTIAGPLIFLAVLSGIYGIGNMSTLGKVGKKLIMQFILMTYFALLLGFAVLLLFVRINVGSFESGSGTLKIILNMILQFIPTDIVSPFLSGNMLQIIFLSCSCGVGMLILGKSVSSLAKIIEQIYSVVQLLMGVIGKLIPLFVFISVFVFLSANENAQILVCLLPICVISLVFILLAVVFYAFRIHTKTKVKYSVLFKKMLPTFLIALTTASSAAAFSVNVETCERKLGISKKITRFGIPLGQVVYMPLAAIEYISITSILAASYGVSITFTWIVSAIIVCGILAIATPPIPGGAMSIFTILFLQLNIPAEALAVAISIDLIVDYIVTAGDLVCLQEELILCAEKMDYINRDVLLKE